ncbi:hypothetical protein [uncultured Microbacterium sp.]|uniref:hypothetical protein n=1 Tax=uncultured Microbacterium sp. TaxID=191216 RepID=UPI0025DBCFED|nr:hypothetical protein [uncultured Microbacterium sp.]
MFGEKRREERRDEEALDLAKKQAAEAVDSSETDDASFEPDEPLEESEETDDVREHPGR